MIKRTIVVLMLILSVAFAISRVDNSKSITTNYLLLSTVEKQNLEQINNVIRFNVPSYTISGNIMNNAPKELEEGKGYKAIIGKATKSSPLGEVVLDKDFNLNNNYVFPMHIEYNNHTKELIAEGVDGLSEEPKLEEFVLDSNGNKVVLVISR